MNKKMIASSIDYEIKKEIALMIDGTLRYSFNKNSDIVLDIFISKEEIEFK